MRFGTEGALQQYGRDIWIADGPPVKVFGPLSMPTRMMVVRLNDGSLWVNSPIEVSEAHAATIGDIGVVRYLVAPSRMHVWRLPAWKARFPNAQVWGPSDALGHNYGLTFDGLLDDEPPAAWAKDLDQVVFRGHALMTDVAFVHAKSKTLIANDFIQNLSPDDRWPWPLYALKRLRLPFLYTRRDLGRRAFEKLLSWDFDRLVMAHGRCVEEDARAFVEQHFRWLT